MQKNFTFVIVSPLNKCGFFPFIFQRCDLLSRSVNTLFPSNPLVIIVFVYNKRKIHVFSYALIISHLLMNVICISFLVIEFLNINTISETESQLRYAVYEKFDNYLLFLKP